MATDDSYRTLPLGIALIERRQLPAAAVALLAMLPVLAVFLVLQRNFIEAPTMSSIK